MPNLCSKSDVSMQYNLADIVVIPLLLLHSTHSQERHICTGEPANYFNYTYDILLFIHYISKFFHSQGLEKFIEIPLLQIDMAREAF